MKEYRSNKYNSPIRRAMWLNLGIRDEDMKRPKIAIVNSSSNLAVCFSHLDAIARFAAGEIYKAGGISFEIRTVAPADFIFSGHSGGFIQASRDLITNDVEAAVEGAMLDGMLCLASCDKTLPGQLMAAARMNIPTIVVACGYQPCGTYKGEHFDIEDLFQQQGHYAMGKVTDEEMRRMSDAAIKGPGVCQGLGTANSMHIACEALGFALPGTTPVLSNSPKMWRAVSDACRRIVELVDQDVTPRDLLTPGAFENCVKTILSVSGSTNTMKHLQAVAKEAKTDIDVFDMFDKFAGDIPLLVGIRPNGTHFIDDLEAAGGTRAVMKQLESKLRLDEMTVSGKAVRGNLEGAVVLDEDVIRPLDNALNYRPAIVLAKGNLAADFGVIKLQIDDHYKPNYFKGPARVITDQNEAMRAIRDGGIKKGDVLVVCGMGLTGTPGMGGPGGLIFALDGQGLGSDVAIVTDGHASGLCNLALMAVDVTPEAAAGGAIGLIRDGDIITIDALNRVLQADVSDEELEARRKTAPDYRKKGEAGWLKIFQERVRPISEGAVIC
ncbi:dihydroxy-acid dehydratase [Sporobacter termitidis DSM 10068]|uniref:Dihydroxy-acid dehydratase n=1 Tax=Sporobacter termitidis DSM 10068 TaxID=1123282 RepID=A0A1M5XII8_9FIRM|nr:dihydroxy-acid dehydratase [Sporobacter termitidis]SHH99083.1 dihydroxy-acid dehydratase [Sporobacter termitidis DSM 10068]